jgi:hypothetical protein
MAKGQPNYFNELNLAGRNFPALAHLANEFSRARASDTPQRLEAARGAFERAEELPGLPTETKELLGRCRLRLKDQMETQ